MEPKHPEGSEHAHTLFARGICNLNRVSETAHHLSQANRRTRDEQVARRRECFGRQPLQPCARGRLFYIPLGRTDAGVLGKQEAEDGIEVAIENADRTKRFTIDAVLEHDAARWVLDSSGIKEGVDDVIEFFITLRTVEPIHLRELVEAFTVKAPLPASSLRVYGTVRQ